MNHGGIHQFHFSEPNAYLDLSVNINPYGPPPHLKMHLSLSDMAAYPDPYSLRLKQILAQQRDRSIDEILIGNGASELLWATVRAVYQVESLCLVLKPTFAEVSVAAKAVGFKIVSLDLGESEDFQLSEPDLIEALKLHRPRLLSLCHPNSPTGQGLDPRSVEKIARLFPETLIILDESFLSLSRHHEDANFVYPDSVIRVQSLTKDFAIAGLRLGYLLASHAWVQKIQAQLPPWSVNILAQAIGQQLFDDEDFLSSTRVLLDEDRQDIESEFRARSIRFIPSCTAFVMFYVETPSLVERLLEEYKILIRPCTSYGLTSWYRIAIRPEAQMKRFWMALDALMGRV